MPSHAAARASSAVLEGIRILDLTTVLMGPVCTQNLGDFGAEVIKVEALDGDSSRGIGSAVVPGMAAGFLHSNRNKRSLAIDLKSPEGRDILIDLVQGADAFISNIRPKALARLGLAYEDLIAHKPDLVYVSLVGYGQNGPYADKPAYDDLIQGALAIPTLVAEVGDGVPRYMPVTLMDRMVGVFAANATLAALLHRQRTGEGQSIEIPMFETMATQVLGDHLGGKTFIPESGEMGYKRILAKGRQAYATADGSVCLMVYTDRQWRSYLGLVGRAGQYDGDSRLQGIANRTVHADALCDMIAADVAKQTTAWWLDACERADIPTMPLHTLESLLDDPHLAASGFFRTVAHPVVGTYRDMAAPGRWSRTPPATRRMPPRLGGDTRDILIEAGMSAERVDELARQRIVGCAPA
ncbi:CaiB/BaiF CoA-transferase family protein [Variovorax sp. KK3]|nr:CoA transferase [Variovorax sp. KK3]